MLIEVSETSQTGDARRRATAFAEELHMTQEQCGQIALVATEMATNLVKHAGKGHILVQRITANGHSGLRIMSVDKGPGIKDVGRALTDGHSTAGSMGSGLGAIQRVPDYFDLYSVPGAGTVINAEFWKSANRAGRTSPLGVGVVSEPVHGEIVCGDGWAVHPSADESVLMVVDGLGHGAFAAEAAREAERVLAETRSASLTDILEDVHGALRKTRGAAVAVARIDFEKRLLTFAGVGNVSASIVESTGRTRSMTSYNGTVGQHMGKFQEFSYPWNSDNVFVMHSDGLATRWDLARYPGIWMRQPALLAAVLHRDFSRERDDVTVLVAKMDEESARQAT
jgi:anti-sigma regulatory factor (Ser/Thr protein kinase)